MDPWKNSLNLTTKLRTMMKWLGLDVSIFHMWPPIMATLRSCAIRQKTYLSTSKHSPPSWAGGDLGQRAWTYKIKWRRLWWWNRIQAKGRGGPEPTRPLGTQWWSTQPCWGDPMRMSSKSRNTASVPRTHKLLTMCIDFHLEEWKRQVQSLRIALIIPRKRASSINSQHSRHCMSAQPSTPKI